MISFCKVVGLYYEVIGTEYSAPQVLLKIGKASNSWPQEYFTLHRWDSQLLPTSIQNIPMKYSIRFTELLGTRASVCHGEQNPI